MFATPPAVWMKSGGSHGGVALLRGGRAVAGARAAARASKQDVITRVNMTEKQSD